MRARTLEIVVACIIVVVACIGYPYIRDVITGVHLEERWAVLAAGELSSVTVRPFVVAIAFIAFSALLVGLIKTLEHLFRGSRIAKWLDKRDEGQAL